MSMSTCITPTPYTYWHDALSGQFGPVHENDPQCGYYRMRQGKNGPWLPVAIWYDDSGTLLCLKAAIHVNPHDVWTWVCRNPVSYEIYVSVAEKGKGWPDDIGGGTETSSSVNGVGHNSSGVYEAESLLEEIEALSKSATGWLETVASITTQGDADKGANYAERFASLETRAEEVRTFEKRPSLEEGRKIDGRWKRVIAGASEGKARMKKAIEPYLLSERVRLIEGARGVGIDPSTIDPPRAGTGGRRIGLRSRNVLRVADETALISHYTSDRRIWSDRAVKDAVMRYAEQDIIAGLAIKGAELVEEFTAV